MKPLPSIESPSKPTAHHPQLPAQPGRNNSYYQLC